MKALAPARTGPLYQFLWGCMSCKKESLYTIFGKYCRGKSNFVAQVFEGNLRYKGSFMGVLLKRFLGLARRVPFGSLSELILVSCCAAES